MQPRTPPRWWSITGNMHQAECSPHLGRDVLSMDRLHAAQYFLADHSLVAVWRATSDEVITTVERFDTVGGWVADIEFHGVIATVKRTIEPGIRELLLRPLGTREHAGTYFEPITDDEFLTQCVTELTARPPAKPVLRLVVP